VGDEDPCNGACDSGFEVLCKPAAASEPSEGPLDDPTARKKLEALGLVRALDDFQRPRPFALQSSTQLVSGVTAIGEDMTQPRIERADRSEHARRAIAVLNIGFMHNEADEVSLRVGDDVTLAAFDFLAGVEAARAAAFRGLHRLAVDDAGVRARFSSRLLARRHDQDVIDARKQAGARPSVEIALHRRVGRKLLRQLPPLAACRRHIQDRVHDRAQIGFARSAEPRARRKQRLDQRPFGIRQMTCVAKPRTPILAPSDFSPGHYDPLESRKSEGITTC
jgi:hypothetical protein